MQGNTNLDDAVYLLGPPYRQLVRIDLDNPPTIREGGWVMAWHLASRRWKNGATVATDRAAGVALAIILPDRHDRGSILAILRAIERSRPQSVLPYHAEITARELATVIRREPTCLASRVADYLVWRGFSLDPITRSIIRRIVELSSQVHTIDALAKNLYMSRRALGRKLRNNDLPVASHWLHMARVLRATIRLQNNSEASLFSVAASLGYTDGFSLSNQMSRLCGIRPNEARERLGWEWLLETWLTREATKRGVRTIVANGRPSIVGISRPARSEPLKSTAR